LIKQKLKSFVSQAENRLQEELSQVNQRLRHQLNVVAVRIQEHAMDEEVVRFSLGPNASSLKSRERFPSLPENRPRTHPASLVTSVSNNYGAWKTSDGMAQANFPPVTSKSVAGSRFQ
jgi:predicted component of type VI protein secretion system